MGKRPGTVGGLILGMAALTSLLAACNEIEEYQTRMRLTREQSAQTRPVFDEYLKRQDEIFGTLKNQRPSGGPGGAPGMGAEMGLSAGMGMGMGQQGMPDQSAMQGMMEKRKKEMEDKFAENDAVAIRELEKYISAEQIQGFKKIAGEIRAKKMKEMMSQRSGRGMGGPGGGWAVRAEAWAVLEADRAQADFEYHACHERRK